MYRELYRGSGWKGSSTRLTIQFSRCLEKSRAMLFTFAIESLPINLNFAESFLIPWKCLSFICNMTALLKNWFRNKGSFAQSAFSICDVNELSGIKSKRPLWKDVIFCNSNCLLPLKFYVHISFRTIISLSNTDHEIWPVCSCTEGQIIYAFTKSIAYIFVIFCD